MLEWKQVDSGGGEYRKWLAYDKKNHTISETTSHTFLLSSNMRARGVYKTLEEAQKMAQEIDNA